MSKDLQNIGNQILQDYLAGNCKRIEDAERVEFSIDGLTLRCLDTNEAVFTLAAKYIKGLPYGGGTFSKPGQRSIKRPKFSKATYWAFSDYGERENAEEYLALYPLEKATR